MSAAELEWGPTIQGARLSISVDREDFLPQEPIVVSIVLENTGPKPITFESQSVWDDFDFDVKSGEGPAELTQLGRRLRDNKGAARAVSKELKPGQNVVSTIQLDRYVDLTLLGQYEVQASRNLHDPQGPGLLKVVSNQLRFRVVED